MPTPPTWDDVQLELLKKLWKAGENATTIADALNADMIERRIVRERGFTRSAVMGKLDRKGLLGTRGNVRTYRIVSGELKPTRVSPPPPRQKHRRLRAPIVAPPPPPPVHGPVTIMGLGANSCRWIVRDVPSTLYCGEEKRGPVYCEAHSRLALPTYRQ